MHVATNKEKVRFSYGSILQRQVNVSYTMSTVTSRALLLVLFKSDRSSEPRVPPIISSLGRVQHYTSIAQSNDQGWTDALVVPLDDEKALFQLDVTAVVEAIQSDCAGANVLVAPMAYSIECVKDTSSDPDNDVFFAVAFSLKEKLDQFPEDWFKATPYMSSCKCSTHRSTFAHLSALGGGFKRSTVYKVIGPDPVYPFINMAVWSSLDSWKRAISTEESKQAHSHQSHVQRTPFIGKLSPSKEID